MSRAEMDKEEGSMSLAETFFYGAVGATVGGFIWALIGPFSMHRFFEKSVIMFGFYVLILVLVYGVTGLRFWLESAEKRSARWHSCEHRSVVLLEEGLLPTRENLGSCPAVLLHCGSVWFGVYIELLMGSWVLLLLMSGAISAPHYVAVSAAVFTGSSASALAVLCWFSRERVGIKDAVFLACGALAFVGPLLFQRFCAIQDPSEEEMAITIAVLEELQVSAPWRALTKKDSR